MTSALMPLSGPGQFAILCDPVKRVAAQCSEIIFGISYLPPTARNACKDIAALTETFSLTIRSNTYAAR